MERPQCNNVKIQTLPVCVDYQRSVEESLLACEFDNRYIKEQINSGKYIINSSNFPTRRKGLALIKLELICFNELMKDSWVLKEMEERGYRPAEIRELLAFAEKYPDFQTYHVIMAMENKQNRRHFPNHPWINGSPSDDFEPQQRYIHLSEAIKDDSIAYNSGNCLFAAVRK